MATPPTPLVKKVSIQPLQQRLPAVNDDKTLAFPLHGAINRVIAALSDVTNFNADTLQLILSALAANGIIVQRLEAIEAAQQNADRAQALLNSYTDPTVIMSSRVNANGTATITIANHNRIYADPTKTSVPVTGGTLTGLALETTYYVFYDDPSRTGGAVTYQYTTDNTVAAQTGNRHSLGGVSTGRSGDTDPTPGGGVSPPGSGYTPRRLYDTLPEQ
jgi:hypothetical protein